MGALLALLLGVAAAFFVLAMPIRMLETVTTFTRLSTLMVQAEPPISPNDRTLLSVLAGILITGIGWVLVDWLVFGRAGMSTLIRTREDDYEDEDEDHFRPTDPLDLVTPIGTQAAEWPMPSSGDARRPLSARTDIGDPPPAAPALDDRGSPLAGINPVPPPIGGILPGTVIGAPPPLVLPTASSSPSTQGPQVEREERPSPSWPPSSWPAHDEPSAPLPELAASQPAEREQAAHPSAEVASPAGLPSWMPAPGMRSDGRTSDPLPAAFYEDPAVPDVEPVTIPVPAAPPPAARDPFGSPPLADGPPLAAQPFDHAPSVPEVVQQPAEPPVTASAPPIAQHPVPPPAPPSQPAPPPLPPLPESGFDRVRLEELLARLEKGLQQRRAAVAAARSQAQPMQPQPQIQPEPQQTAQAPVAPIPEPAPDSAPLQQASRAPASMDVAPAPPPVEASVLLPVAANESSIAAASPYALGIQPPPAPAPAPGSILPVAPPPAVPGGRNDDLLDQPLHVTLDLLRSMVKR
ncbi:hypothetical protein [Sphingomonas sp. Root720]|uniref:hypothetical protein n=2 Tax=Sphingomonas TaxID=13687 RepID=UPI0006FFCBCF|nr:hypothetical protein [Sphingomonas sp. Root720]KQX19543.1 hypothetical protein ASD17_13605 [Sphingomonas sp. Root1294]KQY65744.1 hypothetical protein ASD39_16805 [Sphingomonas sp. Root50]KRB94950.1 hypothetical protein ASE22_03250 [Sphingomonas sp. Root720]